MNHQDTEHAFGWRETPALLTLSAVALAAQVLLVRVFSYTLNHGFVYMAISLAMLGFAAGGILVALWPRLMRRGAGSVLSTASLFFALSLIAASFVFARMSAAISPASGLTIFSLSAWPLLGFVLPFLAAGAGITVSLVQPGQGLARRYALNLVGSAAGCLIAQPLLVALGAERALQTLAVLALLAALPAAGLGKRALLILGLVGLVVLFLRSDESGRFRPDAADQLADLSRQAQEFESAAPKLIHAAWDPVGRIEVHELPGAFGLIGARAPLYFYSQDAGAGSVILGAGLNPEVAPDLARGTLYGLGAQLRSDGEALIVGVGGGPDILATLAAGMKRVRGVDINEATVDALSGRFASFLGIEDDLASGRLELVHADGRGYVRGHRASFDLIQMTGADTYAANPAGASILSESYLYTEEAFADYLAALRPGGVLAVTRFGIESTRIFNTALAVLDERGVEKPLDHIVVVSQGPQDHWNSVLVFRDPVQPEEIALLEKLCRESGPIAALCDMPAYHAIGFSFSLPMRVIYHPALGIPEELLRNNLTVAGKDLRPVKDDRPYFFQFNALDGLPWKEVFSTEEFDRHHWGLADYLRVSLQIGFVAVLFLLLPLARRRIRNTPARTLFGTIVGFGGIGAGFMFLEVVLMQRCALFLGHPNLAISVVLAMLLVASGLGSALAGKLRSYPRLVIWGAILLVLTWIFLFARFAPESFAARLDLGVGARILHLFFWLLPLGLCLGMPFPTGLGLLRRHEASLATWAIAVNGFASVTASLAAIPLSMLRGFESSLSVAACAYVLGLLGLGLGIERKRAGS